MIYAYAFGVVAAIVPSALLSAVAHGATGSANARIGASSIKVMTAVPASDAFRDGRPVTTC